MRDNSPKTSTSTVAHTVNTKNFTNMFQLFNMSLDPCSTSFDVDHMLSLAAA